MDKDSEINLCNKMVEFVKDLNETGNANGGSLVLIEKDGDLVAIGNPFSRINPERLGKVIHNLFLKLYGQKFIDTFIASMIKSSNEVNQLKHTEQAEEIITPVEQNLADDPFSGISGTVH